MGQRRRGNNTVKLWALVVVAIAYGALLVHLRRLTGASLLDGILGMVLGLYICSHPAANAIDFLFMERGGVRQFSSAWSGLGWLALNLLTLLAGWLVIVIGAMRVVG